VLNDWLLIKNFKKLLNLSGGYLRGQSPLPKSGHLQAEGLFIGWVGK
jgi:hypothetical protein